MVLDFTKEGKQARIDNEKKIERLWDLYWRHTKIQNEV